MLGEDGQTAVE